MLSLFNRTTALLIVLCTIFSNAYSQADNFACTGLPQLTVGTTCSTISGNIQNATIGAPTSTCGTAYDVWYTFTTPANGTSVSIDVSVANPSDITGANTYIQAFSASACVITPVGNCTAIGTTLSLTGLQVSTSYYVRVFTTISPTGGNANKWDFDICITYVPPPGNDNCSGATVLTSGNTSAGTVWNASASSSIPVGCSTGDPDDDVWYTITPAATILNISLSGIGADLDASGTRIQLFSGSCAGLTSVACGTTSIAATVVSGNPYYIRVYSAGTGSIGGVAAGSAFSITATSTVPPANDNCAGATLLTSGSGIAGTVWAATASSGIPTGCITGDPDDDVWYRFTPAGIGMTVSLSAIGTNLSSSGARMQIFSGSCGSLTSVACGTTSITTAVNLGDIYYIRVYSAGTGSIGGIASGSAFSITATSTAPTIVTGGRMKEVYMQTTLSGNNLIADPWEVTYGPDDKLWITEAKGYRVYRMDPSTGVKTTALDISQNSTFLPLADRVFNCQFNNGSGAQGGCAGLAIHPDFMHPTAPKKYVYLSYVYSYTGGSAPSGIFYVNRVVRFTYNTSTEQLESPVSLCDTLPGSNDHNSQRMIIAPVGGTNYLFYASGDMGAGQFDNRTRPIKSQNPASYEGKILRFNLESDGDAGLSAWIPNDNPFASNSAVWSTGIRNNQGFAYDSETGLLYGSSHGPYSDDEIYIIDSAKNYGHPLVIGYAADGNYNGSGAGSNSGSSIAVITSETTAAATIGSSYRDALFSAYPTTQANINNIYLTNPPNGGWPSEGWSGMDIYKNTVIPGWKNSLVVSSLKWGRVLKLKLGSNGTAIIPTAGFDTVSYFGSKNRFRDVAFSPSGKDLFVVMDRSTTSSGPSQANPIVTDCLGCVQKYTFLGYSDASGKSSIPTSIDVTAGTLNSCTPGTTVTINNTNNNLWVPITGPDGNILAEIKANGQNLGTITSSFYSNSGALRQKSGIRYLDRNISITPAVQPSSNVSIRLYFSKAEFDVLDADPFSGISSIGAVKILKNSDACGSAFTSAATAITPIYAEAHGANGYVLQADISGFSSFYFASQNITLPLDLVYFKGNLQGSTAQLKWETANETNTSHFIVERSLDGRNFDGIGTVAASGTSQTAVTYSYPDNDVTSLSVNRLYYRLKMFDDNGEYTYSNVIVIALPDITGKVIVFPNPVEKEIKATITATVSGKTQWNLVDNAGRILLQGTKELVKGYNELIIDMDKLAAGVYYLNVSGGTIDQRIKIQKL